jgi:hypothetical protein
MIVCTYELTLHREPKEGKVSEPKEGKHYDDVTFVMIARMTSFYAVNTRMKL